MSAPQAPRIPGATYRVQLTKDFTFRHVLDLVDYWQALGITDLYFSPFLKARPGSVHGYDVIDPRAINPEIGTEDELRQIHEALASRQMGLLMDVVPNHMCVSTNDNPWWNEVLENGPSSPYARFFDIDWRPAKSELRNKVLLPILGNQYGKVLEDGELELCESKGSLSVSYFDKRFPIRPGTYALVLQGALERLRSQGIDGLAARRMADLVELARRVLEHPDSASGPANHRTGDIEALKFDLERSLADNPTVRAAFDGELSAFNGHVGDPRSFDRLESLLAAQAYRLSFWRVAAEQINYRRFFEINDLAAIRIEEPEVLETVHAKPFEFLRQGWITGLRVDHVDGLREPLRYLDDLCQRTEGAYVVVEKILGADERLSRSWATAGTTGYEFLNILNGCFVLRAGERPLRALYDSLRTVRGTLSDIIYQSKRLILSASMSSELSVLTRGLDRISEQHRWSRDFTAGTLEQILADTIACFPVYRTYIAAGEAEVTPQDNLHIRAALTAAQRRNPTIDPSVFAFLADVLLMHDPDGLTDAERTERRDFVLRFQQLTGPVMAKGLEDTTFYRYFPLLSLNEVGGGPERFGLPVEEFHRLMEERSRERAGALSATSTHDTKRGEDSRARLNVLSEIPDEWTATVGAWREIAARLRSHLQGEPVPDADDEYYIYQTLVAALPPGQLDQQAMALFVPRVQGAVEKALREAKRNTSWISPNAAYEQGAAEFVAKLLEPGGRFLPRLAEFVRRIHGAGVRGALSQVTLKIGAPGVPDFFQGTELWDLSMVDPDNRRPVDFMARRKWLDAFQGQDDQSRSATFAKLLAAPDDGHIKLCLTAALLDGRRRDRELFTHGSYSPVTAEGDQHDNIIAFARRWQGRVAIVAAGRFFTRLPAQGTGGIWKDTALLLPEELPVFVLRDVVTGREARPRDGRLRVADLFGTLPCALLVGDIEPGRDA